MYFSVQSSYLFIFFHWIWMITLNYSQKVRKMKTCKKTLNIIIFPSCTAEKAVLSQLSWLIDDVNSTLYKSVLHPSSTTPSNTDQSKSGLNWVPFGTQFRGGQRWLLQRPSRMCSTGQISVTSLMCPFCFNQFKSNCTLWNMLLISFNHQFSWINAVFTGI